MNLSLPGFTAPLISGVAQLSNLGVICAAGPDAAAFLQGQLTQDVLVMGHETARLAAFCNAKGRMQASFVIFKRTNEDGLEEFLMVCSADILAQTLKRLNMFVMRAKVRLRDVSANFNLYGLVGGAIDSGANSPSIHWSKHVFEGQDRVFLYPAAGLERVLCCVPNTLPPPEGAHVSLETWNWLEVQSGIAMISQPTFEAFVPQMLNYESVGGVSFKKGCYPGQEVVARSQFRGTLKRRAYVVRGGVELRVGQDVFHSLDAEQPCGMVAACAAHPNRGFDAIVSMQTAATLSGTLTLNDAQGEVLELLPLPYPLLDDI